MRGVRGGQVSVLGGGWLGGTPLPLVLRGLTNSGRVVIAWGGDDEGHHTCMRLSGCCGANPVGLCIAHRQLRKAWVHCTQSATLLMAEVTRTLPTPQANCQVFTCVPPEALLKPAHVAGAQHDSQQCQDAAQSRHQLPRRAGTEQRRCCGPHACSWPGQGQLM